MLIEVLQDEGKLYSSVTQIFLKKVGEQINESRNKKYIF